MLKIITNAFLNYLFSKYDAYKKAENMKTDSTKIEGTYINNHDIDNSLRTAPTAEEINIDINFNYWNLLLYLFPKTFSNDKEAYDFYEYYCNKAKEFGEKEEIYKIPTQFSLNYKIDMLSGLVSIWNTYTNNWSANSHFKLLPDSEIENESLKNEIIKIYEDNYEHLNKLGIADKFSNGNIYALTHFVININGLSKNSHLSPHYCNDTISWDNETKNFTLPINSIINVLRKVRTNYHLLSEEQLEEIKNNIENEYAEYNCKFNIEDFKVEMQNQLFWVFINTKYFYPAENVESSICEPKLPYKNIEI